MMYEITAEVKKGMQSWGNIKLRRDYAMTKEDLIQTLEKTEIDFDCFIKTDISVKNFQCIKL
ncbi:hypothetical protein FcAc13_03505 [Frischella sp. Ac13]|uniref:Uncharacterized protein n=1 Tax=Frischella japonica TaxID=2741544 RepID=A0ABR7QVX2_9GAMM|nr:hypothetical protein [Frischella japonica]MBC9130372.1 hypothetical protein [Frischella japonica]